MINKGPGLRCSPSSFHQETVGFGSSSPTPRAYQGRARMVSPHRPCSGAPRGSEPSRRGRGDSGAAASGSGPGPTDPWWAPLENTWSTHTATPSSAPWRQPEEAEWVGTNRAKVPPGSNYLSCDWLEQLHWDWFAFAMLPEVFVSNRRLHAADAMTFSRHKCGCKINK